MFFNSKFNKKFEKEILGQIKKVYDYNSNIKVEVTRKFKKYENTLQGEITVSTNVLYLDSLFTPFLKHIMRIKTYNDNLIFDIVTSEFKFNKED